MPRNEPVLLYLSSNSVKVGRVQNESTGAYLNNATVQVTLYDAAGTPVPGFAWPLTLVYVPASNGDYRAVLPSDVGVARGTWYEAGVLIDGGNPLLRRWKRIRVVCREDGEA